MSSTAMVLNRDREFVFMRLDRVFPRKGDHFRGPFQLDNDMVGAYWGAISPFRPNVGRQRKVASFVNVTYRSNVRVGFRLELNSTVGDRLASCKNDFALDWVCLWHA